MNVLLVNTPPNSSGHPLALAQVDGQFLIDWQIQALRRLSLNVTVVLSGPQADEILRHSQYLESCHLVFDPNEQANWWSYIRSGLQDIEQKECLVLPLHVPCPAQLIWKTLMRRGLTLNEAENAHIIQPYLFSAAESSANFPLLITERGKDFISDMDENVEFIGQNLQVAPLPVLFCPAPVPPCLIEEKL